MARSKRSPVERAAFLALSAALIVGAWICIHRAAYPVTEPYQFPVTTDSPEWAELAEAGHAVCINYLTHRQEAETLAEKIRNHGGNAIAVQADVADRAAVEAMVRTAEAELGPVSLLVNNAGIAGQIQFQYLGQGSYHAGRKV